MLVYIRTAKVDVLLFVGCLLIIIIDSIKATISSAIATTLIMGEIVSKMFLSNIAGLVIMACAVFTPLISVVAYSQ